MAPTSSEYVQIPEGNLDEDLMRSNDDGTNEELALSRKMDSMDENTLPDINTLQKGSSWDKTITSIGYMLAMGICGIVLVALGSTLSSLAANVGKTATEVGTVFITRGFGAILGAIFSAK